MSMPSKIRRKEAGWGYSFVLYAGMLGTIVVGLWSNGKEAVDGTMTAFGWVYNFMMVPLQGTMFAILAFFIASAAYRSFRARSREAAVLLIAAVIVMMGRVPLGEYLIPLSGDLSQWILERAECVGAARDPDRRQPRHGRALHQDYLRRGTVVSGGREGMVTRELRGEVQGKDYLAVPEPHAYESMVTL